MATLSRSDIIKNYPIGKRLDSFRVSFKAIHEDLGIACHVDVTRQISNEDLKNLVLDLLLVLQTLPTPRLLPSSGRNRTLLGDLLRFSSALNSDEDLSIDQFVPLLHAVLNNESDEIIWNKVCIAVTESTPPPRPVPYLAQTPWLHTTSSFVNSSEHRKYVDDVLKQELGSSLLIDVPGFYEAFFGEIVGLEPVAKAVFEKSQEGDNPLYDEESGWRGWPKDAKENEVLKWFAERIDMFLDFAKEHNPLLKIQRRILAQPNQPLHGSTAERKLDIGFVNISKVGTDFRDHWSQLLVPGELKSNSNSDKLSTTWRDLARYAREVLTAQDTRRFVLCFTLCGSIMRLWEFDRLGGIASSSFDINRNGLQFVSAVLGYMWMNDEQLGFDSTILESDGKRYIEIVRKGQSERLILDELMMRAPCVVGRATTCWKAHREGDESRTPLVIKDSWQYPERDQEGELLREAMEKGVINLARYYYHETVRVGNKDDDIQGNVRKTLDASEAMNYWPQSRKAGGSIMPPSVYREERSIWKGQSTSVSSHGRKRPSNRVPASLSRKRICSSSPTKEGSNPGTSNRVHRRLIVSDYGKAIYKATSRVVMLAAFEGCIEGYESLHLQAGILQGDVSKGNLMMNEEDDNPSWRSFLIDLDFAIKEDREEPSGARGKTGTRAFMAIGVLLGEKHSFMHDLESFFWVLFWICIHYNGSSGSRVFPEFDKWNYANTEELAALKKGTVSDEEDFIRAAEENFTPYYQSLAPWVNRLRKVIFPNNVRWKKEDRGLYTRIKEVLQEARKDPKVLKE